MEYLKISIEENQGKSVIIFKGQIDENFEYKKIQLPQTQVIHFNLEEITLYNSCGIRNWLFFIREFSKYQELVFEKCSIGVIDQINMIPNSAGNARIDSFYAPYYCESCDNSESDQLINVHDHMEKIQGKVAPEFNCKTCSKPLSFDALEDSYFDFLTFDSVKKSA